MGNEINIDNQGVLEQQLMFAIDTAYAEIVTKKDNQHQYVTYHELQAICHLVKNFFVSRIGKNVKEIDGACELALAVLAPDVTTRLKHVKMAYSLIGGIAGVTAIITAVGLALGWGAGVIEAVVAFFVGGPLGGPITLAVLGMALLGVAAYFAFNNETETELSNKAIKVLKDGVKAALPEVWKQHGDKFSN